MKKISFKLNNKVYTVKANNSYEINCAIDGLSLKDIQSLPARASEQGSCVYRKVDEVLSVEGKVKFDPHWIKIGSHYMTTNESSANKESHGSSARQKTLTPDQVAYVLDAAPESCHAEITARLTEMGIIKDTVKRAEFRALNQLRKAGWSDEKLRAIGLIN